VAWIISGHFLVFYSNQNCVCFWRFLAIMCSFLNFKKDYTTGWVKIISRFFQKIAWSPVVRIFVLSQVNFVERKMRNYFAPTCNFYLWWVVLKIYSVRQKISAKQIALTVVPRKNKGNLHATFSFDASWKLCLLILEWYAKISVRKKKTAFESHLFLHSKASVQITRSIFRRFKFSLVPSKNHKGLHGKKFFCH
jgi:hypothetical protein